MNKVWEYHTQIDFLPEQGIFGVKLMGYMSKKLFANRVSSMNFDRHNSTNNFILMRTTEVQDKNEIILALVHPGRLIQTVLKTGKIIGITEYFEGKK